MDHLSGHWMHWYRSRRSPVYHRAFRVVCEVLQRESLADVAGTVVVEIESRLEVLVGGVRRRWRRRSWLDRC